MKSRREEMRKKRQRRQLISRAAWITGGLVLLAVLGYAFWVATRPAMGQAVAIMADSGHVEEGTDPGPYNSDPPTSGRHYASELEPGFYETNEHEHPEGYLVHNLEHGYIIFWYDCEEVDEGGCEALKAEIRSVLEAENYNKVIAYPRDLEEPVVLTSWGQILRMDSFDAQAARSFVSRNRNKAPEPNAP